MQADYFSSTASTADAIKEIFTQNVMALIAVENMVYIKPVMTEKGPMFGVYSADGVLLATFSTKNAAFYTARQHQLTPVNVQ